MKNQYVIASQLFNVLMVLYIIELLVHINFISSEHCG